MVQQRQDLDAEEQEAREWSQMMVEEEVQLEGSSGDEGRCRAEGEEE